MANEGFIEAEELIREIQKKKQLVRQECRYPEDYSIKISALGTESRFHICALELINIIYEISSMKYIEVHKKWSTEEEKKVHSVQPNAMYTNSS